MVCFLLFPYIFLLHLSLCGGCLSYFMISVHTHYHINIHVSKLKPKIKEGICSVCLSESVLPGLSPNFFQWQFKVKKRIMWINHDFFLILQTHVPLMPDSWLSGADIDVLIKSEEKNSVWVGGKSSKHLRRLQFQQLTHNLCSRHRHGKLMITNKRWGRVIEEMERLGECCGHKTVSNFSYQVSGSSGSGPY